MKVLVTGAKGQLGREIERQLSYRDYVDLVLTDVDELDITNIDTVTCFVNQIRPEIIINCAAYTAVDDCEAKIDLAYRINAIGARNLAIASNLIQSKIIHISTDYVFDGDGVKDVSGNIRPYNEFDMPNPQSAYGKTKLEGERFVQLMNPRHFIIRTAWLYGEGNNFVRTMLKLSKEKDRIKVVDDQHGSPTSTRELGRMVTFLMHTDNYGLFHGTCEGQCTWYEFTKEIFRLKDIKTEVIPCTTEEFPRPAKRPKFSVLDNYVLKLTSSHCFNHWKTEIEEYLK